MAWLYNFRVNVSGSFVVEAGDPDTAYDKALDILSGSGIDVEIDEIEKEDDEPFEY